MNLNTLHIEDWSEFIEKNNINLNCSECEGTGDIEVEVECAICRGKGEVATTVDGENTEEECKACGGYGTTDEQEECEECDGRGQIEPMWNTVWDTGFHAERGFKLAPAPNVFAFEHDGYIWFGLTGCGMDFTPNLALAWVNTFPNCKWMPDNFWVGDCNLSGGYIQSCIGHVEALRVFNVMKSSAEIEIERAQYKLKSINEALEKAGQATTK